MFTLSNKTFLCIFLVCAAFTVKCHAGDPKINCMFDVIEPDGSKYTYDFSGHDYDMVYDGSDYEIIMNLCNTVARPCYPSTCYDTGDDLHNFAGKPCLPWNATANTGNIVFFSTQPGGPPDKAGTVYPANTCPSNYKPAIEDGCKQEACYSSDGTRSEHCTKSCAVVSNSQPHAQLQYPNKTSEGLQFNWAVVPNSNDPRNPLTCMGGGGFSASAIIACDPKADVTSLTIDSVSKISCSFNIRLRSKAACVAKPFVPIPANNNDIHPWGWFSILCFTTFIFFLVYFTLGSIYMYRQKGYCEIPHKFFWYQCWSNVQSSCMSLCRNGGSSSSGSMSQSYNEFGSSSNLSSETGLSGGYNASKHENTVVYDDL
jgi:hypothetical protein